MNADTVKCAQCGGSGEYTSEAQARLPNPIMHKCDACGGSGGAVVSMETNWTPERIRDSARDHVAYGWSPRPGGWTGRAWTEEDHRIYMEEYERFKREWSKRARP